MTNEEMALEEELGAELGDPRRCPRHPDQKTSSNDGMFDAPCGKCEHEIETGQSWEEYETWLKEVHLPAMRAQRAEELKVFEARRAKCLTNPTDDDPLPF